MQPAIWADPLGVFRVLLIERHPDKEYWLRDIPRLVHTPAGDHALPAAPASSQRPQSARPHFSAGGWLTRRPKSARRTTAHGYR